MREAEARHLLAQLGMVSPLQEAVARLAEKALLHDEMARQRSIKGALGQKAAADRRREKWIGIARQLMAERRVPFPSYRALAAAVAKHTGTPEAAETIRKHLALAGVLVP